MSSDNERSEDPGTGAPEQLALIRETVRKAKVPRAKPRTWRGAALAKERPVARVLVNKGVLHLDQYFDYAVPEELDADAQPGVRVRVRFGAGARNVRGGRREGGGLIDGFLVERLTESDYPGALAALAYVVSPEPVLGPELLGLSRAVADRYAGSLADVLQLAVPPRNGRAEAKPSPEPLPPPPAPTAGSWERYAQGPAFLRALAEGGAPRAVWTALPGPHWPEEIARAMAATLASGRGALVVVPDGRAMRPGGCRAHRAARPGTPRPADRRLRTGEAVPGVARRAARFRAGRRRDEGRDVRPGRRSRPGRRLGRRGLQPQRRQRPLPARPGGARTTGRLRPVRVPARRYELHRGGRPAGGERLGASAARGPGTAADRGAPGAYGRRRGAGAGRGRAGGPAAQPGLADGTGRAARRPRPGPGAAPRIRAPPRLRALP